MKLNLKIGRFLHIIRKINHPGLIMSVPGLGKTSTIEMYCKAFDLNLTTLIASQYASDDILGIQVNDGGKLKRLTPSWFDDLLERSQNGKPNILFIDEITTCDEYIQAPLLNLIFSKSLGLHKLPENTFILAAGNYEDCLNKAFTMTAPLVNRFLILNLSPSDISMDELIEDKFRKIKSRTEMLRYLGLDAAEKIEELVVSDPSNYSPDNEVLANIKTIFKNNVDFNCSFKNSMNTGLIGFGSMRSVQYALDYAIMAVTLRLTGADLVDVLSDTVGGKDTFKSNMIRVLQNINISDAIRSGNEVDIMSMNIRELEDITRKLISEPFKVTEKQFQQISKRQRELPNGLYKAFKEAVLEM
jgi:hypothetical protein